MKAYPRAHILQEFHLQCQSHAAKENSGYKKEFEELNDVGKEFTTFAGDLEANREKNRYPYILPYDHCRVRLSLHNFQLSSDYINANFVPGGSSERDFICTQGPLRNTIADFWRMVWEQNVRIIVMLTALRQKDMVLCDQYWPLDQGTICHGTIYLTTVSRKQGPHFFITSIKLRQRGGSSERIVTHYHMPTWPDRGVPKDPASLCGFTELVRQHLDAIPRLGPAVVHCSAGVGRSGTFVALLWMMQLCVRGIQPDVRASLEDLRRHRVWMVQNVEQYIYIHHCLMHWLSGGTVGQPDRSQSQGAVLPIHQAQETQKISGHSSRKDGERRRHSGQPASPQNNIQRLLNPGNVLRRMFPSSLRINPH